jgi:hypothetical protein
MSDEGVPFVPSVERQALIDAVKAHALRNYERGGWDVIVECWDDAMISAEIGRCTSVEGAIGKLSPLAAIYRDRQADAINSAF